MAESSTVIHVDLWEVWKWVAPVLGAICIKGIEKLISIRKNRLEKEKKDPVTDAVSRNILVEIRLDEIMNDYEADRVWVSQFHNGGNFYPTGRSITKFSIFYENVKPGCNLIGDKFQNIPVSIFSRMVDYIWKNSMLCVPDFSKLQHQDFDIKGINKDGDEKSTYMVAIKSIDNKFLGMLGISYIKKKRVLSEERIQNLQIHAATIGSVLSKH